LHDEGVFLGDGIVTHHRHFLQSPQHTSEHGKLIEQVLVHVLSQPKQISLSEACDFVLSISVLTAEHVVNCEPYLRLNLRELVSLILGNFHPLLVLEFLDIALTIPP